MLIFIRSVLVCASLSGALNLLPLGLDSFRENSESIVEAFRHSESIQRALRAHSEGT